MRYISVFSGVEAASVAWEPLGFEPVAFCEVDEFPSAVLAYRYPHVPNLGDITKVDWSEFADGTVDIVIGGSPCQSFSVAGRREGLKGESGLMFEYIRCVREVRPRFFVWENVPGCLSIEKGEAFRQLLSEMAECGYGLAWRVLDAQFFGVAQRRRRVFLVGSLGDQRAAEILFEPESLRWDYPSSREKRKELTRAAQQRAKKGCGDGVNFLLYENHAQDSRVKGPLNPAPTVSAKYGTGGGNTPLVLSQVPVYCIQGDIARGAHMGQNGCGWSNTGECYTLNTIDIHAVCMASGQANAEVEVDMAPAQAARQYKDPQIVCYEKGGETHGA